MTTMSAGRPFTTPLRSNVAFQGTDTSVLFIAGLLMTLGVVMVYSASVTVSGAAFDWRNLWNTPLRQGLFALLGFVAAIAVGHMDYRLFAWDRKGDAWWVGGVYALALALLVAVLIPGIGATRLGAQRAIFIPAGPLSISFQPSEFAKVALVIWLSALLTRPLTNLQSFWGGFVPALGGAGILIGLTGIEDFGTAALMGVVAMIMLFVAGARWSHLLISCIPALLAGVGLLILKPYRMQRIMTFLTDDPDPRGDGYQITQSLIAIGSGGWWGSGLGAGVQKYGYLPQDNNDFIFAVVCEELGFAGAAGVVLLFLLFLWRGWRISRNAIDPFGRLLAIGVTLTICIQAAFNIAVVTKSVPTKGISLPFVSAGGSGVLFLGLAVGLLASVGGAAAFHRRQEGLNHPGFE